MRIIIFLLVCFPVISIAQQNKILMETTGSQNIEWSDGSILTTDEEELKGLVKYNSRTGVLNYEYGNDTRSLSPRGVVAFEFYDADVKKQRIFYSLEFEERFQFFELLFDFLDFAVISKREIPEVNIKSTGSSYFDPMTGYQAFPGKTITVASQVETICFLNLKGEIIPYLEIENIESERTWSNDEKNKNKRKVIDNDLLEEFLGEDYELIEAFVKENDLKLKKRDDLMKVFEYYATVRQ